MYRGIIAIIVVGIIFFSLEVQAQGTQGIVIDTKKIKSSQDKELPLYESMHAVNSKLFSRGDFIFMPPIGQSVVFAGTEQMQMGQKMDMYQSGLVDGCTDHHCLKCTDRDRCSEQVKCSLPNCGHIHGAVLCHGGVLFYLRTSAGYYNCHARAKSVANKLNSVMRIATRENYKFELEWTGDTPAIWHMTVDGSMREKIVTITPGDVEGYRYRAKISDMSLEHWKFSKRVGGKTVGKIVVAEWWLALLTDHLKLMAQSEKPTETTDTYYGSVLYKMWEMAKKKHPSGPFPMSIWPEIVNELPQEDKDKLYMAARIIPKDFFAKSRVWEYILN